MFFPSWDGRVPKDTLLVTMATAESGLEPVRYLNADLREGQMVPKMGGRMLTRHTFPQLLA